MGELLFLIVLWCCGLPMLVFLGCVISVACLSAVVDSIDGVAKAIRDKKDGDK